MAWCLINSAQGQLFVCHLVFGEEIRELVRFWCNPRFLSSSWFRCLWLSIRGSSPKYGAHGLVRVYFIIDMTSVISCNRPALHTIIGVLFPLWTPFGTNMRNIRTEFIQMCPCSPRRHKFEHSYALVVYTHNCTFGIGFQILDFGKNFARWKLILLYSPLECMRNEQF
jgi:hypothetical protein